VAHVLTTPCPGPTSSPAPGGWRTLYFSRSPPRAPRRLWTRRRAEDRPRTLASAAPAAALAVPSPSSARSRPRWRWLATVPEIRAGPMAGRPPARRESWRTTTWCGRYLLFTSMAFVADAGCCDELTGLAPIVQATPPRRARTCSAASPARSGAVCAAVVPERYAGGPSAGSTRAPRRWRLAGVLAVGRGLAAAAGGSRWFDRRALPARAGPGPGPPRGANHATTASRVIAQLP
jgi:hypothetical protein